MLPNWLNKNQTITCPCCSVSVSRKTSYLKKTINTTRNFMVETILQEKEATKDGLLQALDPRIKFIATIVLITALSLTHYVLPILTIYLLLLMLAYFSKLEIEGFLLRPLFTVGFFSILVMLPATLNIFIPGNTMLKLGSYAITDNGLKFLLLFSLRSLTMASTASLLVLTTKREKLLTSLRTLHIPPAFTMLISTSYRFIAVLIKVVENVHLAKKSRTIKINNDKTERGWVTSRMGWTFAKAIQISTEVTQAMISRGWQGD